MLKDEIEHSGGARALMAAMQYDLRGDEGGEAEEGEGATACGEHHIGGKLLQREGCDERSPHQLQGDGIKLQATA